MNTCEIEIKNKNYVLCLNRNAIKAMESKGFDLENFSKKPITYMEILWFGGFVKNYPELTMKDTSDLLDQYQNEDGDINEVITFLAEEYSSFVIAPADTKSTKKKATITRI